MAELTGSREEHRAHQAGGLSGENGIREVSQEGTVATESVNDDTTRLPERKELHLAWGVDQEVVRSVIL